MGRVERALEDGERSPEQGLGRVVALLLDEQGSMVVEGDGDVKQSMDGTVAPAWLGGAGAEGWVTPRCGWRDGAGGGAAGVGSRSSRR